MDGVLEGRALREEQAAFHTRLYATPGRPLPVSPSLGVPGFGPCTIRMLLTWFSHWRGAAAVRHPTGIWPCSYMGPAGPIFELGPAFGPEFPLLSDTQVARLLCEGCPFVRPSLELIPPHLDSLELDTHDSAARMRAILCASIFHEWREGTYAWRREEPWLFCASAGYGCRLAHSRATMARLIAGANVHMFRQGPGIREATTYPDDYFPPGGLQLPAVLEVDPAPGPPAVATCACPAGAPAPRRSSRHRP